MKKLNVHVIVNDGGYPPLLRIIVILLSSLKTGLFHLAFAMTIIFFTITGAGAQDPVSSRAYKGHENDKDANNFARVYPAIVGTRLDDCQTCHRAGVEGTDTQRVYNTCEYCHMIPFPTGNYKSGVPKSFEDTLNAYGKAYKSSGRTENALREIEKSDADGDGYSNEAEIAGLRYPGDPASRPKQPLTPSVVLDRDRIISLPVHRQFLLMNTHKQHYDEYVFYSGVKVKDLLEDAGVDLKGATSITVFAPDGYSQDFSLEEVLNEFPKGVFRLIPGSGDPERDFVKYPDRLPMGLKDKSEMPDPVWLMIAYEMGGKDLDSAYYQSRTGRLAGDGPYRLAAPQKIPGRPDRGSKSRTYNDGWDFDQDIDHNAGKSVRGMCVIRVNPMPSGLEEYDWRNGWSLIADRKIVVYGHSVMGNR